MNNSLKMFFEISFGRSIKTSAMNFDLISPKITDLTLPTVLSSNKSSKVTSTLTRARQDAREYQCKVFGKTRGHEGESETVSGAMSGRVADCCCNRPPSPAP